MAALDIRNLRKEFEDDGRTIVAVDDVTLSIKDGEFVVLVGPSGCGKTTTLRSVAGLIEPTSGDIRLDDSSIVDQSPKNRDIAMVFQDYALYPHMSARENMSFGLKMSSELSESEIDSRVQDTAELMGIGELLDKKPGELSGGQQQRVALGRAIVREPSVFLMDEPLSNLDAKLRRQMRTEIQNLQKELDVTTMYVTHDQTEAMTMSDRVAILNDGELQQFATPLECYHEPANRFVAGFIGSPSMNFIDCTVSDGMLEAGEFTYPISDELAESLAEHSKITLGIRPSDMELASESGPKDMVLTVDVTEPMGDQTHLYFELNDNEFIVTVTEDVTIGSGDRVRLKIPEENLHIFDRQSGETIRNRVPSEDDQDVGFLLGHS